MRTGIPPCPLRGAIRGDKLPDSGGPQTNVAVEIVGRTAWSDESFQERDGGGFYVLAAAIIEEDAVEEAREAMRRLRGSKRATHKLHWNEMDDTQRRAAAKAVAKLAGLHVVTVGSPVPRRRQERARSKCLESLLLELHGFRVDCLYIEAREHELNRRDIQTATSTRRSLPKGEGARVEHVFGAVEPLLWIPDIVAGACRMEQLGNSGFREMLGDGVMDINVDTDC